MAISARQHLTAGIAALAATAVVLPGAVNPPPLPVRAEVSAPSAAPHLTQAMVKLLAEAKSTAAAAASQLPAATAIPNVGAVPTAATTTAVTPLNAASDWLTGAYVGIQAWVDWGVNYAVEIAYWLGGWGVPFAGTIGAQTSIIYWSLIRPISDDIFYRAVVPIVNNPLNLGVWINGIGQAIRYSIHDVVNFGIAEFNYFLGWILPPLPPLPPLAATAAAAKAKTALAATATTVTEDPAKALPEKQGKAPEAKPAAEPQDKTAPSKEADPKAVDTKAPDAQAVDVKAADPKAADPSTPDPKSPSAPDAKSTDKTEGSASDATDGQTSTTKTTGKKANKAPKTDKAARNKTDKHSNAAAGSQSGQNPKGTKGDKGSKHQTD